MSTIRLDDGFSTIITLENIPAVKFYEKEVTPPGMSGGGAIDTTTMRNARWRTMSPKALVTLTPVTVVAAFATEAIVQIQEQVNVNQRITVTFPDESTLTFWGWVDEFALGKHVEGEQPTATITIQPSNHDNTGGEVAPDYEGPSGSL